MNSNLFWCIIGIVGGAIISLIITLIFHIIGKTRKHISCKIITSYIISNDISEICNLEIKYNNTKINNLYLSRIEMKNTGNTIIEKDDFSSLHPLTVKSGILKKMKILYSKPI